MVRLAGHRRAVEEEVGRVLNDAVDDGRVVRADFDLGLGIGVVADQDEATALPKGRVRHRIEREIFLHFQLGAIEGRLGRVGKARINRRVRYRGIGLDRIVDRLVEARCRQALVAPEVPFIAQFGVPQLTVGQRRVAAEQAVRIGILIDLRNQLAELRARNRL